jgi:large subunit ribosomal protein L22
MAEQKKDSEKKTPAKKPAAKKTTATKTGSTAKKPAARKPAAKKPAAGKSSESAPAKPKAPAKKPAEKTAATKTAAGSKTESKPKAAPKPKATPKAKEVAGRPVVNARARYVRIAPRKARMIADQVRGLHIDDARALLRFSNRGAAGDIRKLIESAAANAEANHDLVADDLLIKDIHVDEGPTLRRYRPRALGRATRINKRTSHIAVALTPEE